MPISAQPAFAPSQLLRQYFDSLLREFGPQQWWPARTRLEVILGAILTQNTSWQNAALGIKGLRKARLLSIGGLKRARQTKIEAAIRSSGFYRQKARTIRNFMGWLDKDCGRSLNTMFQKPVEQLRQELLNIQGLGPETVDAILLYAGGFPTFVADAYTRRILSRHGHIPEKTHYDEARTYLHSHLHPDAKLFNEYHALLVETGKRHCHRSEPDCHGCPLESFLLVNQGSHKALAADKYQKVKGMNTPLSAPMSARNGRMSLGTA